MASALALPAQGAFIHFPKLPAELQNKILKTYLEDEPGRLIEVRWSKAKQRYFIDAAVPPLLHVDRGSRAMAKKYFELITVPVNVTKKVSTITLYDPVVYNDTKTVPLTVCLFQTHFNFNHDTLYLNSEHFRPKTNHHRENLNRLPSKLKEFLVALNGQRHIAERLRALAVDAKMFYSSFFAQHMFNMVDLEYVHFIFGDHCCLEGAGISGYRIHQEAFAIEQIQIPDFPTHRQQNPTMYTPNALLQRHGPMTQINGYPHFIGQTYWVAMLSKKEQYVIGDIWQDLNNELIMDLERNVAEQMEMSQGLAREHWQDLTTTPCRVVRRAMWSTLEPLRE
ncbi:hypothetical protein GLAREA_07787 [Glarea lozoyensis ATCC 20868]|uniref:2EXR domain-containing protein n=1 Tax=Glarea lozoyensis (strain ATCC 20868 / MF5171) TaxID=1116229 RepID=S3E2G2_GLAL2|nr:uncharacterized protein GLAREA_07787 [Glarea lozoyensis ATCC 20868]EPE32653.1 hypothetical protein GLAREA_07787 [Glarea lozoyensis ATCC 20868]